MSDIETYDRKFGSLLDDALRFLILCNEATDFELKELYARTSALYSMLLLESSANICIDSLDLDRSTYNEIDRLPMLTKFDFYLRLSGKKNVLKRGDTPAQKIKEIKKLRDDFVHPKKDKVKWEMDNEDSDALISHLEVTPILKVTKDHRAWDFTELMKVTEAIHSFLRHYFIELCEMTISESCGILYSETQVPSYDDIGPSGLLLENRKKLEKWGLEVDYLCGNFTDDDEEN